MFQLMNFVAPDLQPLLDFRVGQRCQGQSFSPEQQTVLRYVIQLGCSVLTRAFVNTEINGLCLLTLSWIQYGMRFEKESLSINILD
jgi:hypothetical protein